MSGVGADDVRGLILAGGQSRRFGTTDKARHRVEGTPMIRRVYDAMAAVAPPPVLIGVADPSASFADCLPEGGIRCVTDVVPNVGPLAGLVAGLEEAAAAWVLVAACDLPFLSAEALRALLSRRAPGVEAVAARASGGMLQPLCALYRRETVLPVARRRLENGRLALRDLLRVLTVRSVRFSDAVLRNVNRLSDL